MATIKFLLQSKTEQSNIYVRLSIDRNNVFKRKSGYIVNSNNWSATKGYPTLNDDVLKKLKTDLDKFKNKLEEKYNIANRQGQIISGNWLQKQIDDINNKRPIVSLDILVNYIQHFIDNAHTRKNQKGNLGLTRNRIKSFTTFLRLINKYQAEIKKEFLIKDISPQFANEFKSWLFNKNFSINYVGKNLNNLKTICRDADKNNIETHPKLRLIESVSESTPSEYIITLSFGEIEQINKAKLKHTALINARKWLVLGCYLGQRGSDLLNITEKNMTTIQGLRVIELEQQKTGKKVVIPVLPEAEEIINSGMPYKLSLQKFNNHLKKICEIAELDQPTKGKLRDEKTRLNKDGVFPKYKLIGSHICRRSFATNYYGQIPTPILIGITGHSTERMFLKYIGKTAYDNAKQMFDYVSKLKPSKPQTHLKVVKRA